MFHPSHSLSPVNSKYFPNYGLDINKDNSLLSRPALNGMRSDMSTVTRQQFTKHIVPAPYPKLSASSSDANIVDSIFTQSQVF